MKKLLIAAFAALSVVAVTAVSFAQTAADTKFTAKVTPKDAGTKQDPKSSKVKLKVVNGETRRTASDLDIYLPKAAKLSLKGLRSCTPEQISQKTCPTSRELGRGSANALAGVNSPDPSKIQPLAFAVTAYKTTGVVDGKTKLAFFLDGPAVPGRNLDFLAETSLHKAKGKYGQRLHVDIPDGAQRTGTPPAVAYNGLVSFQVDDLGKKRGNNALVATTGCKRGKHPFKVVITFVANGVTDAGKVTKTTTSSCKP